MSIHDEGRAFLAKRLGADCSSMPNETVEKFVEEFYLGGWTKFATDYAPLPIVSEHLSPIQQYAKLRQKVGGPPQRFRLKPHEEVVKVEIGDDRCFAVIKTVEVEMMRSFDKIVRQGLKLMSWERVPHPDRPAVKVWTKPDILVAWEDDSESMVRLWGAANTPERHAARMEEYELCYRPGTHKTPMQGWVARLELSHEQAHADEFYPKFSSTRKQS